MAKRKRVRRIAMVPAPGATYELDEDEKDFTALGLIGFNGGNPANAEVVDPRPSQRVPEGGGWVLITRELPPLEGGMDTHVRVGRCFYAQHLANADAIGFLPDGRYKVRLETPWGTLHLWPYEYTTIDPAALLAMWQSGEMVFHATDMEPARLNAVVFYARSRGIGLADAMVMALGTLAGPVGWFEPHPDLAEACEVMARRVNQWPWDPSKRLAAQRRKQERVS